MQAQDSLSPRCAAERFVTHWWSPESSFRRLAESRPARKSPCPPHRVLPPEGERWTRPQSVSRPTAVWANEVTCDAPTPCPGVGGAPLHFALRFLSPHQAQGRGLRAPEDEAGPWEGALALGHPPTLPVAVAENGRVGTASWGRRGRMN